MNLTGRAARRDGHPPPIEEKVYGHTISATTRQVLNPRSNSAWNPAQIERTERGLTQAYCGFSFGLVADARVVVSGMIHW